MIHVLLFAQLQEDIGRGQLELDANGMTIGELKKQLMKTYHLQQLDQTMTAINEEYAQDQDIVKAGDTVAFIPPVSGG